jgi:hypothetical protein
MVMETPVSAASTWLVMTKSKDLRSHVEVGIRFAFGHTKVTGVWLGPNYAVQPYSSQLEVSRMADQDVFAAMGIGGFGKATKKRTLDPARFDKNKREEVGTSISLLFRAHTQRMVRLFQHGQSKRQWQVLLVVHLSLNPK